MSGDTPTRVALITGCGKENGIGAATARRLAANGFIVAASDVAAGGVGAQDGVPESGDLEDAVLAGEDEADEIDELEDDLARLRPAEDPRDGPQVRDGAQATRRPGPLPPSSAPACSSSGVSPNPSGPPQVPRRVPIAFAFSIQFFPETNKRGRNQVPPPIFAVPAD